MLTLIPFVFCRKKRNVERRAGELTSAELQALLKDKLTGTYKKSDISKMSKLRLCEVALRHGFIGTLQFEASLPRRSEGRKCYLHTLLRHPGLRVVVDHYVQWWTMVMARGTHLASCFCSVHPPAPADLLDLTFLKKLIYPERYPAAEQPPGLQEWLAHPLRHQALQQMLPPGHLSFDGTTVDQALTYMARRLRGNIKVHVVTHAHTRAFELFGRRFASIEGPCFPDPCVKRAIVNGDVNPLLRKGDFISCRRVILFRQECGLFPEDVIGPSVPDFAATVTEDQAMAAAVGEGDGGDDDEAGPPRSAFEASWEIHVRMSQHGAMSMLPLFKFTRSHAIIDGRIMRHLVLRYNNRRMNNELAAPVVDEKQVMEHYFKLSRDDYVAKRKSKRKGKKKATRKQYHRAGTGRFVPSGGKLITVNTDGVSAVATFDVPIRREKQLLFKNEPLRGIKAQGVHSSPPQPIMHPSGEFEALSADDVAALRKARLIGGDPGDNNPLTIAELVRTNGKRVPRIQHLSRKNYEGRTRRRRFQAWEAQRRRDNPEYDAAMLQLSLAGAWASGDPEVLDRMLQTMGECWNTMVDEVTVPVVRAKHRMVSYRKQRMVLDQTATRMLAPALQADKRRAVVVGFGKAKFKSRGPCVKLLQALLRRMKDMRRRGIVAILVFIDEFRTTCNCHRCFGFTTDERISADRRFRDCRVCGTEAAPKRWGRDSNAALNMLRKLDCLLRGVELPPEFRRPEQLGG